MEIFISWSGARSRQFAEALRSWLPRVVQAVNPWISASDIEKGSRWLVEISERLGVTNFGLICVTPENVSEPWLLFEAGALSKALKSSRVCPILLDITPVDLKGPLAQFQATLFERADMAKLLKTINASLEVGRLPEDQLQESLDLWWPKLESAVAGITASKMKVEVQRNDRELLEEVVDTVRRLARNMEQPRPAERPKLDQPPEFSLLRDKLATLSPAMRTILELKYSPKNLSWDEIARLASTEERPLTANAARVIANRAMQKLINLHAEPNPEEDA
jgi:hypothetical protein